MNTRNEELLPALNRRFIRALLALGDAGQIDAACRLAASAWSVLHHRQPREAERLNGVLHALTKTTHPATEVAPQTGEKAVTQKLDVRQLIPMDRHRIIFETYGKLKSGDAFELINDHDPKPLYYQFEAEHTGQFSWNYLEKGPVTWRVEIGRV